MIKNILVYECDLCGRHEEIKGPKIRKAIPDLPNEWARMWFIITSPEGERRATEKIHVCLHCYKRHVCKRIKAKKVKADGSGT